MDLKESRTDDCVKILLAMFIAIYDAKLFILKLQICAIKVIKVG